MKKYIISLILLIFNICAYSQVINLSDTIFGLKILKTNPVQNIPIATNLSITGSSLTDSVGTLEYTYYDLEGDSEGTSLFKWYRNSVFTDSTRQHYVYSSVDSGYYMRASVIPVASTGFSPGIETFADSVGPILTYIPRDTFYVSTTGDNSANGTTTGTPWQTLGYADSNATAGAVICLKKGDTWSTATSLQIKQGGTAGKPMVWDGSIWGSGANAIIQQSTNGAGVNKAKVHISGCNYVTFQNITVDCNNKRTDGIVIGSDYSAYGGLQQNSESHIIVQDCEILDCGDEGDYRISLLVQSFVNDISNITIQRNTVDGNSNHGICCYNYTGAAVSNFDSYVGYNTITNCGRDNDGVNSSILVSGHWKDLIVEHNTITQGVDGHAPGIAFAGTSGFPEDVIVRRNNIRMTDTRAWICQNGGDQSILTYCNILYSGNRPVQLMYNGAWDYTGSLFEFYYNTIIGDGTTVAVEEETNCGTGVFTFRDNIIVSTADVSDNAGACLAVLNTNSVISLNHNLYHRSRVGASVLLVNYGGSYKLRSNLIAWDVTAVITDPTFTVEFTNLHLQTGSPAIGAGVAISGITEDIEGNPMQEYIGAYQTIEDP